MTNFSIKLEGLGQAPAVRILWLLAVGNFCSDKTISPALKGLSLNAQRETQKMTDAWRMALTGYSGERLEVVLKPQIRFKGKAQADEKTQSRQRRDEQYILKRFATQLLDLRWGFDTTSRCYLKNPSGDRGR
jgi:hypothetical protein